MELFKPEDFDELADDHDGPGIADLANKKFNRWLEQQPKALAHQRFYPDRTGEYFVASTSEEGVPFEPSHTARLVDFKEIK